MFKLEFDIPKHPEKINLKHSILLIGACFSDEIGNKLEENKFKNLSNPFGTIYNPHSIFKLLRNSSTSEHLIESQGIHYHWDAHGAISGVNREETIKLFEEKKKLTQAFLRNTKWLIITLGTSIVYEQENGDIVANCHKVATKHFKNRFISRDEIIQQFSDLHSYLKKLNPRLIILFTISPVRHIRDGLVKNNRSKAILIDAVHSIVATYSNTSYFPSFEIIMDELRDYRFYAGDMIHPSNEAIEYVWQRFKENYFDSETNRILEEWGKLRMALNHKSFHPKSISHQKFLRTTLNKLEQINEKIELRVEIEQLKNQIL